jgi:hypothetical protein
MPSDMAAEGSLFPAAARAKLTALGGVNVVCLIGLLTGIGNISKQTRARLLYQARINDSRDKTYSVDSHDSMSVLRCRFPPFYLLLLPSTTIYYPLLPSTTLYHQSYTPLRATRNKLHATHYTLHATRVRLPSKWVRRMG